jgi:DNA-binding IclR family transcriptional regulator
MAEEKLYGGPLLKAIDILDFLRERQEAQTTTAICEGAGLTKGTASKLLSTMQKMSLVTRDTETQKYVIGSRLIGYGQSAIEHYDFKEQVLPLMQELHERIGETVHLGVRAGDYMMYLNKLEAKNPIRLQSKIGGKTPMYTSAMAKAFLANEPDAVVEAYGKHVEYKKFTATTIPNYKAFKAEIAKIREQGYSEDNEEFEQGVASCAVAMTGRTKNYGAISVSVPVYRLSPELKAEIIKALLVIKEKASKILN